MQKLKLKIHYCLVNHLVINTSVLYRSPFLQWQGDVDVIAPSLHVDVETAVGACRTFLVGDDKAVGDDNHAATGLGLHLVRHIELEGLHRAVVQTHFEIEVVGAFRGAGAVAVVVAGVVGNAERKIIPSVFVTFLFVLSLFLSWLYLFLYSGCGISEMYLARC